MDKKDCEKIARRLKKIRSYLDNEWQYYIPDIVKYISDVIVIVVEECTYLNPDDDYRKFVWAMFDVQKLAVGGRRRLAIDQLDAAIRIILDLWSGKHSDDRAEITGISTNGKNKNMGNTGFSGGCTARLAAAN